MGQQLGYKGPLVRHGRWKATVFCAGDPCYGLLACCHRGILSLIDIRTRFHSYSPTGGERGDFLKGSNEFPKKISSEGGVSKSPLSASYQQLHKT